MTDSRKPRPLVSILMTCYNREAFIAEAIESALASTLTDVEIIIVDDASTDRSAEIARTYTGDPRVSVHVNETNLGDYPNRNRAAGLARGRYLKYLDSDDKLYPHGLEVMVEAMERFPDAAVGLSSRPIPGLEFPAQVEPAEAYRLHFLGDGDFFDRAPLSAILRADTFHAIKGFKSERMTGDQEMWMRLAAHYPIVLLPVNLGWYRVHDGQECAYERERGHEVARLRYDVTIKALRRDVCPLPPAERERAERLVRRQYARRILASARAGDWRGIRTLAHKSRLASADFLRAVTPVPSREAKASMISNEFTNGGSNGNSFGKSVRSVLIFAEDYPPQIGGIATHAHELARALRKLHVDARVMTVQKGLGYRNFITWRARRIERDGVPVLEVPLIWAYRHKMVRAQQNFRFGPVARKELRDMGARVFHWHNIAFDPEVAMAVNGSAGMVFTNHSSQFLEGAADPTRRADLLSTYIFAHRVIAPSRELAARTADLGYPFDRTNYIPNGVDTERFRPDAEDRRRARAEFGIRDNEVAILCARRIVPKCGVVDFAHSLERFADGPPVVALVAGLEGDLTWRDHAYEARVRLALGRAPANVRVVILGQTPNDSMPSLYRAADISVLPSLMEATSISGLESMACGTPVVGTTVGGIPDMITDGEEGLLVPPDDPVTFGDTLHRLVTDPGARAAMAQKARARVEREFSWPEIARRTLEIYGQAAQEFTLKGPYTGAPPMRSGSAAARA